MAEELGAKKNIQENRLFLNLGLAWQSTESTQLIKLEHGFTFKDSEDWRTALIFR